MPEITPWVIPTKTYGKRLRGKTDKWDSIFIQAATEIAAEVSIGGPKIGYSTLLVNLATQRGAQFTEVRRRLNQRVKQLTKENQRHAHQNKPTPSG